LGDSHIDLIPPEAAGRSHSLTPQAVRISNSDEVASAGEGKSPSPSLSDAQLSAFWDGIIRYGDDARRMAAQLVSRQNVDDVVHTAAVLFIEWLQKKPTRFPKNDDDFRYKFLHIAHNHAINCVSGSKGPEHPIHSRWGVVPEPALRGHKVGDRELGEVFARNNNGKYDVPAPVELPVEDAADHLHQILHRHLAQLPPRQRQVIHETFFLKRERQEIARRLGISVCTYDNHLQAAYRSFRKKLTQDAEESTDDDRSHSYDVIAMLNERRKVSRLHRDSGKTGKRSMLQGEGSTVQREGSSVQREHDKTSGAGAA
jgi:RNA polymerase sigma factor (sigma-70 family)